MVTGKGINEKAWNAPLGFIRIKRRTISGAEVSEVNEIKTYST